MRPAQRLLVPLGVVAFLAFSAGSAFGASPAALWHMNETTGTTMGDASGNGHAGTLKNVRLGVAGVGGTTGYGFNGTSSVALVPDSPALNPGAKDLVVTVHVALTKVPDDDYDVIRKGLSTTKGGDWKIEVVNVSGQAIARCYLKGSTGSWQKTTGPNLADGAFHTITCERHATTVVLSVDGRIWKSTKTVGNLSNTAQVSIGAKAEGGDWLNGRLDEVSIVIG